MGSILIDPEAPPVSFAQTPLDATASPMMGPPRQPGRVRVADPRLATEVREAMPDIDVVMAPTPELDRLLQHIMKSLPPDEDNAPSYFEGGRISAEALDPLFHGARLLYGVAPWKKAQDTQALRLDIPALGAEGACLSVIGAMGESLGFVIFPSLRAFETLLELVAAECKHSRPCLPVRLPAVTPAQTGIQTPTHPDFSKTDGSKKGTSSPRHNHVPAHGMWLLS